MVRPVLTLVTLTFLGWGASGCSAGALKTKAASDMKCDKAQVSIESIQSYVEKVSGCGQTDVYVKNLMQGQWQSALDRASFDMDCPRDQLSSTHLGGVTVGVTGCGSKMTYVAVSGNWVANTDERPANKSAE